MPNINNPEIIYDGAGRELWGNPRTDKKYLLIKTNYRGKSEEIMAYYFTSDKKNFIFYELSKGEFISKHFSPRGEFVVRKTEKGNLPVPAFKIQNWSTSSGSEQLKKYLVEVIKKKESLEVKANTLS
jgi:hypothetical protein